MTAPTFPVDQLRNEILSAVALGPTVLTAPTGSGKSTQVPRWCGRFGRVLVVEPRRVACIGLSAWTASLEGVPLGREVGYAVRDDRRMEPGTRLVFATPGMVLRWMADTGGLPYDVLVIDEFHERSLEIDLLLALSAARFEGHIVVMSATMEADRVADFLGGRRITGEGRQYPVTVRHKAEGTLLPSPRNLEQRVASAVKSAAVDEGDILVFLPGKSEIRRTAALLERDREIEVLCLHGGLSLSEQSRIFEPGLRRRVILSTNVAETSITVPNIGVVIDSGLVRRTRYFKGRGYLTLLPIAKDSASQRAGRAGRVREGVCYRLWSEAALQAPYTEPEIYRESLTSLVLSALACRADIETLRFLDAPKPYQTEAALLELAAVGAVDAKGALTKRGRRLFGFPLPPTLGSFLVEAEKEGCLEDAVDLAAALAPGRPLFVSSRQGDPADDLRIDGCDAVAAIRALRFGVPKRHGLNPQTLEEARAIRRRLAEVFGVPPPMERKEVPIDRRPLIRAALRSDPGGVFVVRVRRGQAFLADGRTEIQLAKDSAVDPTKCEGVFVFQSMAVSKGFQKDIIFAAAATPVSFRQMAEALVGEETITGVTLEKGVVKAEISRMFAGAVLAVDEVVPEGEPARAAVSRLIFERRLFPGLAKRIRADIARISCARELRVAGRPDLALGVWQTADVPTKETWVADRLTAMGFNHGADVALLTEADLEVPSLPEETEAFMKDHFPASLRIGNALFDLTYDFAVRTVTLVQVEGGANARPSLSTLPSFRGFTVKLKQHSKVVTLR